MKAFLNRINRGLSSRERDRDKDAQTIREKDRLAPQLPPLPPPDWLPPRTTTPSTLDSTNKPLPEISLSPLPADPAHRRTDSDDSSTPTPVAQLSPLPPSPPNDSTDDASSLPSKHPSSDDSHRSRPEPEQPRSASRRHAHGTLSNSTSPDVQKKTVAFISPPVTPTDRALPEPDATSTAPAAPPLKTTVSRFQAAHGKDTRGSTSTATSSRTDVASTARSPSRQPPPRAATSPFPGRAHGDGASIHPSLRSGTPYSQASTANSSRILGVSSWSEGAEEDLVSNIGQRERTRQEVLWEIVASEERYVGELLKMKDTFIDPLLHPYSAPSPTTSPSPLECEEYARADTPRESLEHLPIAARFLSPTPARADSPGGAHPTIDGESLDEVAEDEADDRLGAAYNAYPSKSAAAQAAKHAHPRSPYGAGVRSRTRDGTVPFPTRSHTSLPPPPRMHVMASSTTSLGRQSLIAERDRERERDNTGESSAPSMRTGAPSGTSVLRKFKRSNTAPLEVVPNTAVPPRELPEDLRKCLEVIEGGILEGHQVLSRNLRKRYEEQYPLVRSLADVFVAQSHILHGYATYVLHLERALEQVDNAHSTAAASKKPKKQDAEQWMKICQTLQRLELVAAERGETGLAISLSKPFQRLLKYPLLFQNLLYHTDPSTFEYESTVAMVHEVQAIVRSIEDEKIQKEERDKTRDVFARIDGLEKVKQLMVPKPSRVLVEERPVLGVNPLADPTQKTPPPPATQNGKNVRGKTSFKRLSDVLQPGSGGVGGKKDQWLVVFNDVVLRCQRTGTTSLPLVAATNSRTNSLPELQGKAKYATTGRRSQHTKPRNMYKFLKIETWAIGDVVQPQTGVVSMEDVVRSRQQAHVSVQPRIVPLPDDDEGGGGDSDDSDRKSKMSFSYWGADKVTIQKPINPKQLAPNPSRRGAAGSPTQYARESSANAKFGTRLVAGDSPAGNARAPSRRTQATPSAGRRPAAADTEMHSAKATVTRERPAWDTSTRATATPIPKRTRNLSQTSAAARTPVSVSVSAKGLASPAPSEDSGVGLYRQIIAQNPSLNALNANA